MFVLHVHLPEALSEQVHVRNMNVAIRLRQNCRMESLTSVLSQAQVACWLRLLSLDCQRELQQISFWTHSDVRWYWAQLPAAIRNESDEDERPVNANPLVPNVPRRAG